ncbi:hypothetical protein [Streptomyces antimicrobicus]|uniref:Hydrogenase expression protein HypF n=1 Tax=Streptomyces antimicrobicus TaxID=2883108 RepID=A0ABS8AZU7_9ACTN|nr:hypothetical protein [Streptomyces antimicrobicus]MCB5177872.1 hypothetical protein [Streptomyces antimicrobicus]
MRGDQTQAAESAPGDESRGTKGPRHAAPRKSLLTKFHIPVGRTMALAAMPTAVFVGMGMAPKLAVADDKEIPFLPGPCVTRSDGPTESASPSPSTSPSTTPSPQASPGAKPSPGASPKASTSPGPTVSPSAPKPGTPPTGQQAAPAAAPTATPSAGRTTNPLDPLGVGDALRDLFGGLGKPATGTPGTPAPTAPAPAPSGTATPAPGTSTPAKEPAKDPVKDPAADAIREAAKKAGVKVEELPQDVKDTATEPKDETGAKDGEKDADADGKQPFPCPTLDAEALANAQLEAGIPALPDEPWYLDSSLLTLYGLDYEGIVEVRTGSGKVKKVLKFTADSLDIKDLYQTVGKGQNIAHLKSRPGSTSKIRGGKVTMYTESLKGNLFGLIPIEFSPTSPPPLNVPFAFFTDVKVVQAGQFGGTLTVPGLKNYIGPPE